MVSRIAVNKYVMSQAELREPLHIFYGATERSVSEMAPVIKEEVIQRQRKAAEAVRTGQLV